jgi:TM2 domain-containing membrane protein YozV
MGLIQCPECKKEISDSAQTCPNCGFAIVRPKKWSPGLAALFSLIIPGAGQMYRGKVGTGLLWLVFVIMGYVFFIVPGIILHLVCIFSAAAGDPTK